jgi:hypothetical protein
MTDLPAQGTARRALCYARGKCGWMNRFSRARRNADCHQLDLASALRCRTGPNKPGSILASRASVLASRLIIFSATLVR